MKMRSSMRQLEVAAFVDKSGVSTSLGLGFWLVTGAWIIALVLAPIGGIAVASGLTS